MKLSYVFIGVFLISHLSFALNDNQQINYPNHCDENEQLVFSAKMQRINRKTHDGSLYKLDPTSKILSFCLSNSDVYYRYGRIGEVELEHVATSARPLNYSYKQIGKISENNYSFQRGTYRYVVSESNGMGSGYGIKVFNDAKLILELFSGNEKGKDFYKNNINIPIQTLKKK